MYDVIIIGAGPAGITASLYTVRGKLKTLVIYNEISSLEKANKIENYYGFENGINGQDLYEKGINQAKNLGVEIKNEEVVKISKEENFIVETSENKYTAKAVILATGNKKNIPDIKGIKEFEGKGISYCAICDGFFYKNKDVAIIGNGNYAVSEANELINVVNNLNILTNGEPKPEVRDNNIKIETNKIKEIKGTNKVQEIEFENNQKLKVDGIFIAYGVAGSTDFARTIGAITKENKIIVNENMETNVEGLYACGDAVGGIYQISKAVYEGTKAGLQVIKYLRKE